MRAFEPADGWSRTNLLRDHGEAALDGWRAAYPELCPRPTSGEPDLDAALDGADLVLVHEWNDRRWWRRSAAGGAGGGFLLLFHDTHHRAVSDPGASAADLDGYDGVLAFGACLRERYLDAGWAARSGPGTRPPTPRAVPPAARKPARATWSGSATGATTSAARSCAEFLLEPVRASGLRGAVHGVRYPEAALDALAAAGIAYRGWLPNHRGPESSPPPGDRPRAAPALRRGAARHPDHPRVRGAGLRHPAGLRALARREGLFPPGRTS